MGPRSYRRHMATGWMGEKMIRKLITVGVLKKALANFKDDATVGLCYQERDGNWAWSDALLVSNDGKDPLIVGTGKNCPWLPVKDGDSYEDFGGPEGPSDASRAD